jgi:dGTPase
MKFLGVMNMNAVEQYNKLITAERIRKSIFEDRNITQESESDRGRLVLSAPFRRLQQKAQVFSLEDNAAVRSRLTHSIEVSQLGRYIADELLKTLEEVQEKRAFTNFVETACLMHDLGNPPFGHFGEAAISQWFLSNARRCIQDAIKEPLEATQSDLFDKLIKDLYHFDGNCQGFRIVTRLQWNIDEHGLNLTASCLAAFLKYVCNPNETDSKNPLRKKAGYFFSEEDIVKKVWGILGMKANTRHPLAYIMEAADDIAYCISDIEDAIEKKIFSEKEFIDSIRNKWSEVKKDEWHSVDNVFTKVSEDDYLFESLAITNFRIYLSRFLTKAASENYVSCHEAILNGTAPPLFSKDSEGGTILNVVKGFARARIYSSRSVTNTEVAGYSIIKGLLEQHECLLSCTAERFEYILNQEQEDGDGNPIVIERKVVSLLPKKYIKVYKHLIAKLKLQDNKEDRVKEWHFRAHLIADYICGMTDDFALATYQNMHGINLIK